MFVAKGAVYKVGSRSCLLPLWSQARLLSHRVWKIEGSIPDRVRVWKVVGSIPDRVRVRKAVSWIPYRVPQDTDFGSHCFSQAPNSV